MEVNDFSFDVSGLLSDEEAAQLFEEKPQGQLEDEPKADENKENGQTEKAKASEGVGLEEHKDEPSGDAISQKGDGSSPTKFYSSIASALKNDGIFPDEFTDEEINAVNSPEDFGELFEKAIEKRMDAAQQRIDKALRNGVEPDAIRSYEQTLGYLSSISDDAISAEGDEGEALRSRLIYNDLVNRGYSHEKALREVEKSLKSGSDIDDAKDALSALISFYTNSYDELQKQAEDNARAAREQRKKDGEAFRKLVLEDDIKIGESSLDKRTRQQIFDAVSKPVWKDPDTGALLTKVQKFQKEHPMEFLKQIGMWFVLTSEGKNFDGLVNEQVRAEKNKGIRELERKINSTSFGPDGSLKYMSGNQIADDVLLSDDWQINMGNNG